MNVLQIARIKPNPAGKDRSRSGASPAQLGGEWVDIKNVGRLAVDLAGLDLYHLAYGPGHPQGRWEKVASLTGGLTPGWTIRLHAGRHRDLSVLHPSDIAGAELHAFTGADDYVWNNLEGDTPLLWLPATSAEVDKASYDPSPPEGAVLVRFGAKLLPTRHGAGIRI